MNTSMIEKYASKGAAVVEGAEQGAHSLLGALKDLFSFKQYRNARSAYEALANGRSAKELTEAAAADPVLAEQLRKLQGEGLGGLGKGLATYGTTAAAVGAPIITGVAVHNNNRKRGLKAAGLPNRKEQRRIVRAYRKGEDIPTYEKVGSEKFLNDSAFYAGYINKDAHRAAAFLAGYLA